MDLSRGGLNTIDNLDPPCRFCHRHIQLEPHELAELWERQQQLYSVFQVGDRVYKSYRENLIGVIIEIFPARSGAESFSGFQEYKTNTVHLRAKSESDWADARAIVSWPWRKSFRQTEVDLHDLVKIETEGEDGKS